MAKHGEVYVLLVDGGDAMPPIDEQVPGAADGVGEVAVAAFSTYGAALEAAVAIVGARMREEFAADAEREEVTVQMRDPLENPDARLDAANEIWGWMTDELGTIGIVQMPIG